MRAERTASAKALRLQERFGYLRKRKKAIVITAEWLSGRKDGATQDPIGLKGVLSSDYIPAVEKGH